MKPEQAQKASRDNFDRILRRTRLQCDVGLFLEQLALALSAGGAVAILFVAAKKLFCLPSLPLWMLGAVAGAALPAAVVLWLLLRPNIEQVAVRIDQRLGTRERFSTALALSGASDPFARAACAEARRTAGHFDVKGQFPVRPTRRWILTLTTWLVAAGVLLLMPPLDLLGKGRAENDRKEEAKKLDDAKVLVKESTDKVEMAIRQLNNKELSDELAKLGDMKDAAKADDVKREAIRKLDDLAQKLDKLQNNQKMESLKDLKDMLKGLRGSPQGLSNEINRNIAKGDFQGAAQVLKDIQKQIDQGKLTKEQKDALNNQLKDLARQLESIAEENKKLQDELEKQGLDKELAKLDGEKLKEALEKQGLTKEQVEQLMKKAEACKSACRAAGKLAKAMSKCAQAGMDGQSIDGPMAELTDELGELEAAQAELEQAELALSECKKAMACLGKKCDGEGELGGIGEWDEGDISRIGKGTGGPGVGWGKRPTDPNGTPLPLDKTKVDGKNQEGPAVASWYYKGPQVKGESKKELKDMVKAGSDAAAAAINENEIPKKYEGAVRKYFDGMEETAKDK
ncbi:MAG: hypothetical protein ACE15C_12190 [Phycisphaerae bacterium]